MNAECGYQVINNDGWICPMVKADTQSCVWYAVLMFLIEGILVSRYFYVVYEVF